MLQSINIKTMKILAIILKRQRPLLLITQEYSLLM